MKLTKLTDKVSEGVKINNSIAKIVVYAFVVCFIAMLFFNYLTRNSIRNESLVITENGKNVEYEVKNRNSLLESTITVHCERASYLLNSFDRINLKSNQAKSLFLIESKSVMPIIEYYQKTGNFNKALKLGYTYRNTFQKLESLDLTTYPYSVVFTTKTEIYNGGTLENEVLIKCTGKISTIEANFKQSPQGYYLTDYTQDYTPLKTQEDE